MSMLLIWSWLYRFTVGDHPPAAITGVGVPDVILLAEDILASEFLHMLDLKVIPGLGPEIALDLLPFVRWRLHDIMHARRRDR